MVGRFDQPHPNKSVSQHGRVTGRCIALWVRCITWGLEPPSTRRNSAGLCAEEGRRLDPIAACFIPVTRAAMQGDCRATWCAAAWGSHGSLCGEVQSHVAGSRGFCSPSPWCPVLPPLADAMNGPGARFELLLMRENSNRSRMVKTRWCANANIQACGTHMVSPLQPS